jgi:hypothetical protein
MRGWWEMPFLRASILILSAVVLGGCAGSYHVVSMPQREADLYPLAQTKSGVTIAIDEVKGAARAERYFGADLIRKGILPVVVVVSNYGKQPVVVKPADVMLHRGREIIDPLPLEVVLGAAKSQHWFLRSRTEEQIDSFFRGVAFTETTLSPSDSYQGVMFFTVPRAHRSRDTSFLISSLFREGGPKVRVGVTNLDTQKRMHFGPFSLSLPEGGFSTVY